MKLKKTDEFDKLIDNIDYIHEYSFFKDTKTDIPIDEFLESLYDSQSNTNNDTTNENQITESNTQTQNTDSKTQIAKSLSSSTQIIIVSGSFSTNKVGYNFVTGP